MKKAYKRNMNYINDYYFMGFKILLFWLWAFHIASFIVKDQVNIVKEVRAPQPKPYVSPFLEALRQEVIDFTPNLALKKLIKNCMLNTLETTVIYNDTDAFVITGDINAMWLRDSMNQLYPFVEFVRNDTKIDWLVRKVISKQVFQVRADPFANAFNYEISNSPHGSDWSQRLLFEGVPFNPIFAKTIVFERKFEIDSLAALLRLSNEYFKWTKNSDFVDIRWVEAVERLVAVVQSQRLSFEEEDNLGDAAYKFQRQSTEPTQSLQHGRGNPVASCGLIRSPFRPSDDSTTFLYFIPGNCMMQRELQLSLQLLSSIQISGLQTRIKKLMEDVDRIQREVKEAIYKYGIAKDQQGRDIFAFQVDCYGNQLKMDDANSPSLLALPYLGFIDAEDPLYQNTRDYIWSKSNPYYFEGKAGAGIGGPHSGLNMIWPMSLIMKALTSSNANEIQQLFRKVSETTAGTYFMHESFNKDNENSYTRSWFAWANTMYGHLVLKIYREFPSILKNYTE